MSNAILELDEDSVFSILSNKGVIKVLRNKVLYDLLGLAEEYKLEEGFIIEFNFDLSSSELFDLTFLNDHMGLFKELHELIDNKEVIL